MGGSPVPGRRHAAPTTQGPGRARRRGGSRSMRPRSSDHTNASFAAEVEWKVRGSALLPHQPGNSARCRGNRAKFFPTHSFHRRDPCLQSLACRFDPRRELRTGLFHQEASGERQLRDLVLCRRFSAVEHAASNAANGDEAENQLVRMTASRPNADVTLPTNVSLQPPLMWPVARIALCVNNISI